MLALPLSMHAVQGTVLEHFNFLLVHSVQDSALRDFLTRVDMMSRTLDRGELEIVES